MRVAIRPGMPVVLRQCVIVLATLLTASCMQMSPDYEQPTVTVTSFRSVPGGSGLNFAVELNVINPNREPLELQGVAYTISVEGRKLVTGVGTDLPVIDGYSEGTLSLSATASMLQVLRLLGDLVENPDRDALHYELDTKLDVGTFYPAIRVKDTGEFRLTPQ